MLIRLMRLFLSTLTGWGTLQVVKVLEAARMTTLPTAARSPAQSLNPAAVSPAVATEKNPLPSLASGPSSRLSKKLDDER